MIAQAQKSEAQKAFEGHRLQIRFSHSLGMPVEAKVDDGQWFTVQLTRHADHPVRHYGWGKVSYVMDVKLDEKAYLNTLDAKGIAYEVVCGDWQSREESKENGT